MLSLHRKCLTEYMESQFLATLPIELFAGLKTRSNVWGQNVICMQFLNRHPGDDGFLSDTIGIRTNVSCNLLGLTWSAHYHNA